jgi:hypothetical protein
MISSKIQLIKTINIMIAPHKKILNEYIENKISYVTPQQMCILSKSMEALEIYNKTLKQINLKE